VSSRGRLLAGRRPFDLWSYLVIITLGGYMFFGRPFAYLAIPGTPLYIGELVMILGVVEALLAGRAMWTVIEASPTLKVLLAFMAWCAFRLIEGITSYGLDAVRDSALWYYATFAFITATAALVNEQFVPRVLKWYRWALPAFLLWAPVAVFISRVPSLSEVTFLTDAPVNGIKPGDVAIHVALAIVFLWFQLDRVLEVGKMSTWRAALPYIGLAGLLVAGSQGRSGFLGAVVTIGIGLFMLTKGERRRIVLSSTIGLTVIVVIALTLNLRFSFGQEGDREFSVQQVLTNVESIVGGSSSGGDEGALQGNESWRLEYWSGVWRDAYSPQYLLTGQGFGPVLSFKYGIEDPDDPDNTQPLRSVHNSHLTVLARVGWPGAILWLAVWFVWLKGISRWVRGRRSRTWGPVARLAAWCAGGVCGFLLNAFFDPALDGPMCGVWTWFLVGLGVAYVDGFRLQRMGYNIRLPLAGGDGRDGAPERSPASEPAEVS
jgi:hypothetical protein